MVVTKGEKANTTACLHCPASPWALGLHQTPQGMCFPSRRFPLGVAGAMAAGGCWPKWVVGRRLGTDSAQVLAPRKVTTSPNHSVCALTGAGSGLILGHSPQEGEEPFLTLLPMDLVGSGTGRVESQPGADRRRPLSETHPK